MILLVNNIALAALEALAELATLADPLPCFFNEFNEHCYCPAPVNTFLNSYLNLLCVLSALVFSNNWASKLVVDIC